MAALTCLAAILCPIPAATAAPAAQAGASTVQPGSESPWPYTVRINAKDVLQVFPPQVDSWDGLQLRARAAVVMREGASGDAAGKDSRATYGVIEIAARTLVDKGTRRVTLDQYSVVKAQFPSAGPEAQAWVDALQKDAVGRRRVISLDRLEAQVQGVDAAERHAKLPLKNDAPAIVFSRQPAILVSVDGPPRYVTAEGTSLERVLNTRVLLLRDAGGRHYLHVFDGWMTTGDPIDGTAAWSVLAAESADLRKLRIEAGKDRAADLLSGTTAATSEKAGDARQAPPSLRGGTPPRIVVATRPTELVVSDGDWLWTPIAGTQLLYVKNTTGNILRDNNEQQVYLLISGRWFRAPSESGPWSFVAANALPADFAHIPDDSEKENVKASIAGTPQAREAAIATNVPQTAAVRLTQAKLPPLRFDGGAPRWTPIAGTSLSYAPNTPTPLIQVDTRSYFALDNGVWFTAPGAEGPWVVATAVPPAIYTIPPSSPLFYVTYVRIFGLSGDYVYVGYTGGYQGEYVDPVSGVVVYGTGYVYDPWIGTSWVGAPVTYGYGAAATYTPWIGWTYGFCFGWAWGAATSAWAWGWGPYPYWGPWAYGWGGWWGGVAYGPAGGAAAWGPGGWAGFSGPIYRRWGDVASVSRVSGGFDAWSGNRWAGRTGIAYNSRTGAVAAGQRGVVGNVYTGNYAAGSRGVAQGPGGVIAGGARGTAGNAFTGNSANANRGFVYNPATGQGTTFAGASGDRGAVGRIGDDVYAGHDGNVYRNTGDGWQKHTGDGWQPVNAGGAAANAGAQRPELQQLDQARDARTQGMQRNEQLQRSNFEMNHSFGGAGAGGARMGGGNFGGGGFHGGGFRGGGFRGRR